MQHKYRLDFLVFVLNCNFMVVIYICDIIHLAKCNQPMELSSFKYSPMSPNISTANENKIFYFYLTLRRVICSVECHESNLPQINNHLISN